ncbi:hypothetical protein J6590_052606 [Homalodisca vitripennis]|nr:hypothetical protein J6590_052606 [Homalodisca vitripennis]
MARAPFAPSEWFSQKANQRGVTPSFSSPVHYLRLRVQLNTEKPSVLQVMADPMSEYPVLRDGDSFLDNTFAP